MWPRGDRRLCYECAHNSVFSWFRSDSPDRWLVNSYNLAGLCAHTTTLVHTRWVSIDSAVCRNCPIWWWTHQIHEECLPGRQLLHVCGAGAPRVAPRAAGSSLPPQPLSHPHLSGWHEAKLGLPGDLHQSLCRWWGQAGSCTPAALSPLSPLTETVWGVPGTAQGVPLVSQHSWHVHGPALIPSCLAIAAGAVIQRTPHLLAAGSHWSWSTERFSGRYVMPVRFLMWSARMTCGPRPLIGTEVWAVPAFTGM